ncbi:MAG: hypothetical protein F6J97_26180 [Leptolyngbya sp. SIO4C1]|nr:hypothetical protein [Leptolyngbya sp. SIO4C1]
MQAQNFIAADAKLLKAAKVAPWDPVYSFLSAEQLIKLSEITESEPDKQSLKKQSIENLVLALKSAPNDIWGWNNLAVIALEEDPALAQKAAEYSVQLLPRSLNYPYYALGLTYLKLNQKNRAATAFALEGIINPKFMIADLWKTGPFLELQPDVLAAVLETYERILESPSLTTNAAQWTNRALALLSWWYQKPNYAVDESSLSPLIRAVSVADQNSDQALSILNDAGQDNAAVSLLKAWLSPEEYLSAYLSTTSLEQSEIEKLRTDILSKRDIRNWLSSTVSTPSPRFRYGLSFAYRNAAADSVTLMLRPSGLETSVLVDIMELFSPPPRQFPVLDNLIEETKDQLLGIPHPTRNNFELSSS